MANLTHQSATDNETQNGTTGPKPKSAPGAAAHDTSLPGSRKLSDIENAMVNDIAVSMVEPGRVDTSGARHHSARRSRSNTDTSSIWPIRKAVAEPMAARDCQLALRTVMHWPGRSDISISRAPRLRGVVGCGFLTGLGCRKASDTQ